MRCDKPINDAVHVARDPRIQHAFDLIAAANGVTILSLDEMECIVARALEGEFEELGR